MKKETAVFYRRMLSAGLADAYQRDIESALEKENPLSDLLLELVFCLSDINQTISVLDRYIADYEPDEHRIYPLILAEIKALYKSGRLSLAQAAETLFGIMDSAVLQFKGPWKDLTYLSYEFDEVKDGYLYMDDFLITFSEFLDD